MEEYITKKEAEKMIQQGIATYMAQKQYTVSKIPGHIHSGTDTTKIPISSIVEAIPVTGKDGGVFDPFVLDTQKVNINYAIEGKTARVNVFTLPINVIYGYGVGVHSAFNGGDAEPGTMIFFDNAINSKLWIKTFNNWYGIDYDTTI